MEQEQDWRLTTKNRVEQVNWLRESAYNIATWMGKGNAEQHVAYALSREGRESWGVTIPEWFDDHDRALLVEYVGKSL